MASWAGKRAPPLPSTSLQAWHNTVHVPVNMIGTMLLMQGTEASSAESDETGNELLYGSELLAMYRYLIPEATP